MSEIWGYRRPDGTFGIRNHVAILSVMDNINPIVRQSASLVLGSIPLACGFGRGERGKTGLSRSIPELAWPVTPMFTVWSL